MTRGILTAVLVGAAAVATACSSTPEPQVATANSTVDTPEIKVTGAADELTIYLEGTRKWVKCLRDKGVDVSDPDPAGVVTFPGDLAAHKADPKFEQAQQDCAGLQPPVPESVLEKRKPKLTPQQIETQRKYAGCMQTNGAPDFPDPGPDDHSPRDSKWDQASAGAQKATRTCAPIIGDPAVPATTQG